MVAIQRMKFLDELLGPPACWCLTLLHTLSKGLRRSARDVEPVRRILLIKFFGMGSILQAGPMVRALRDRFPDATITILTFQSNRELCEFTGMFNAVVAVRTTTLMTLARDVVAALARLRRERFDIAVDMEFFAKSSTVISYLAGARTRVGFALITTGILFKMFWRGNLNTREVFYNSHRHIKEVFLALAAAVGAETDDWRMVSLPVPRDAVARLEHLLQAHDVPAGARVMTINVNAGPLCPERRWPQAHFGELIALLSANGQGTDRLILIGGPDDVGYVTSFANRLPGRERIVNLAGQLSIPELAALLLRSTLLITNDSGPLHLAVALDRPTVSFFGPESPERYGPEGPQHTVFYVGIYCSPCLNVFNQKTAPCGGDNQCLKRIAPADVYQLIRRRYLQEPFARLEVTGVSP